MSCKVIYLEAFNICFDYSVRIMGIYLSHIKNAYNHPFREVKECETAFKARYPSLEVLAHKIAAIALKAFALLTFVATGVSLLTAIPITSASAALILSADVILCLILAHDFAWMGHRLYLVSGPPKNLEGGMIYVKLFATAICNEMKAGCSSREEVDCRSRSNRIHAYTDNTILVGPILQLINRCIT